MSAIIELRSASKTYKQGAAWSRGRLIRAVDNVTLSLKAGRRLALIGASGSGKSTLGRLILGLEPPDSGEALLKGKNWKSVPRAARRAVQAVFQNSHGAVNPGFTALDIIEEPLKNFDNMPPPARRARVEELLHQVGLKSEDMTKHPHQFSGGELQRVCLARALAPRPELIVLDEALSALDESNQERVLRLLEETRTAADCGFVMISHDMRIVKNFADDVLVMENGKAHPFA